jgi:hypothetical protein
MIETERVRGGGQKTNLRPPRRSYSPEVRYHGEGALARVAQMVGGGIGLRLGLDVEKRLDRIFKDNTGFRDSSWREEA